MDETLRRKVEDAKAFFALTIEMNDDEGNRKSSTVESAETALVALQVMENAYALFDTLHEKVQASMDKNRSFAAGLLSAENLLVEALDVFDEEKERER